MDSNRNNFSSSLEGAKCGIQIMEMYTKVWAKHKELKSLRSRERTFKAETRQCISFTKYVDGYAYIEIKTSIWKKFVLEFAYVMYSALKINSRTWQETRGPTDALLHNTLSG